MAGFQPVFDRLGRALNESGTGAGGAADRWLVVADRVHSDTPSEAVVVRYTTGPPRLLWPLLILVPLGHAGDERIDPEPPALRLTAVSDDGGARVELPDGDLAMTAFVLIDDDGRRTLPGREHVSAGVDRLTWGTRPESPVVIVAVERTGTGWRVGAAAPAAG